MTSWPAAWRTIPRQAIADVLSLTSLGRAASPLLDPLRGLSSPGQIPRLDGAVVADGDRLAGLAELVVDRLHRLIGRVPQPGPEVAVVAHAGDFFLPGGCGGAGRPGDREGGRDHAD